MSNDILLMDFHEMMTLAAYDALKNFDAKTANIPKVSNVEEGHPLDSTIEAIAKQFSIDFKTSLTTIAYRDFAEKLSR